MKSILILLALCAPLLAQLPPPPPAVPPAPIHLGGNTIHPDVYFDGFLIELPPPFDVPMIVGTLHVGRESFPLTEEIGHFFSMGIAFRWTVGDDRFSIFIMPYDGIGGVLALDGDYSKPICLYP
jgi:hypothetical protein